MLLETQIPKISSTSDPLVFDRLFVPCLGGDQLYSKRRDHLSFFGTRKTTITRSKGKQTREEDCKTVETRLESMKSQVLNFKKNHRDIKLASKWSLK